MKFSYLLPIFLLCLLSLQTAQAVKPVVRPAETEKVDRQARSSEQQTKQARREQRKAERVEQKLNKKLAKKQRKADLDFDDPVVFWVSIGVAALLLIVLFGLGSAISGILSILLTILLIVAVVLLILYLLEQV